MTWWPVVLLLASLFTLAVGPVFHLAVGHATFLPYFYLPWILFLFISAIRTRAFRYAAGAGAGLALTIYSGGLHMAFMAAIALVCFSVAAAAFRREWHPLVVLGVVGVFSALLAAPKLVPTLVFLRDPHLADSRSFVPGGDTMNLNVLEHSLLDLYQYRRLRVNGQSHGWWEYANYIGTIGAALLASSFVSLLGRRPWRREHWLGTSLAVTAVVLLALTFGEFSSYAPFALLRRLPMASQLRVPSRYSLVFLLFATAMAATVIARAVPDLTGEARRLALIAIVLAVPAFAYWNSQQLEGVFPLPPLQSSFRWYSRPALTLDATTPGYGRDSPMLRAIMEDRAIVQCYEPLQLTGNIDRGKPLVFSDGNAEIVDIAFAPNHVQFRALSHAAARVYPNQRYTTGWRSDVGGLMVDPASGLGYVSMPPNAVGKFAFWFVPPGLITGFGILLVGISAVLLSWRRTLGPSSIGGGV